MRVCPKAARCFLTFNRIADLSIKKYYAQNVRFVVSTAELGRRRNEKEQYLCVRSEVGVEYFEAASLQVML
jgi:hypothetical protein